MAAQPANDVNQRITALRDGLQGVVFFGRDLAGLHESMARNRRLQGEPSNTDLEHALSDEPSPDEKAGISNAWASLLRECRETLDQWWTCWAEANAALDQLPKHLVDDQNVPMISRWSYRVRLWLNTQAEWLYWSNPNNHKIAAVRVLHFMSMTRPDDWPETAHAYRFDQELKTIQNNLGFRLNTRAPKDRPPARPDGRHPDWVDDELPANTDAGAVHSDDFRSVRWFGTDYTFTGTQAACVRVLWDNWRRGTPVLSGLTILDAAESDGDRLRDVFDRGQHPAWGTMICKVNRDSYRLTEPKKN